jgi:hypothetical protein
VDRDQVRRDWQPGRRQEPRLGQCLSAALWLAAALHCAGAVACAGAEPAPRAPAGKLQISDSAAAPPEPSGGAALEIIPGRVRSNYISKSDGATAAVDRNAQGWHLTLSAPAAQAQQKAESAGYCWEITELNATKFSTLALDLSQVSQPGEIQVRLEQQDATVQEAKLEYLTQGILVVDLANYPRVRPALARLCLVASGSPDTAVATRADFVLRRAMLQ